MSISGRAGSAYFDELGYYLMSGFSDPENYMLGASYVDGPFCTACVTNHFLYSAAGSFIVGPTVLDAAIVVRMLICCRYASTGCSITTAQNLAFQAEDELDAAANPVDVLALFSFLFFLFFLGGRCACSSNGTLSWFLGSVCFHAENHCFRSLAAGFQQVKNTANW